LLGLAPDGLALASGLATPGPGDLLLASGGGLAAAAAAGLLLASGGLAAPDTLLGLAPGALSGGRGSEELRC
jgi:hypothetical protein